MYFVLPETKGIPLEEIAKLFGDDDEVMVYAEDIHVDRNTHELVVEEHGKDGHGLHHVATEGEGPGHGEAPIHTIGEKDDVTAIHSEHV